MKLNEAINLLKEKLEGRQYGQEIVSRCPICNASEKKFYINATTGKANCKRGSCGWNGNATSLFKHLGINDTITYPETDEKALESHEKAFDYNRAKLKPLEESDTVIIDYMASRGISLEAMQNMGVMVNTRNNSMAFPFVLDKKVVGLTYRTVDKRIFKEAGSKQTLLGIDTLPKDRGSLHITEGEIDLLTLREAGIANSVSVPNGVANMAWIDTHWDFLNEYKNIVLCYDNDDPGRNAIAEIKTRLDFANLFELDYKGNKDINDMYMRDPEQFFKTIKKPRAIEMDNFVSLQNIRTDAGAKDFLMSCGISQLDRIIGGMGLCQSTIIFCESGGGKSTMVSNIVRGILSQNEKCCIFSGELSNSMLKSWLYSTIGGEQAVDNKPHPFRPNDVITTIKAEHEDKIDKIVDGRLFIYDGNKSNGFDMLKNFEKMHKRHGIKFFFIDNLSILDMSLKGSTNQWEAQEEFSKAVASFTRNNRVHLFLVAHPTKTSLNSNPEFIDKKGRVRPIEMYSQQQVKGSASIVNLAHNVMAMQRAKAHEKAYYIQKLEDTYLKAGNSSKFELLRPVLEREFSVFAYMVKSRQGSPLLEPAFFGYDRKTRRVYGITNKEEDLKKEVEIVKEQEEEFDDEF